MAVPTMITLFIIMLKIVGGVPIDSIPLQRTYLDLTNIIENTQAEYISNKHFAFSLEQQIPKIRKVYYSIHEESRHTCQNLPHNLNSFLLNLTVTDVIISVGAQCFNYLNLENKTTASSDSKMPFGDIVQNLRIVLQIEESSNCKEVSTLLRSNIPRVYKFGLEINEHTNTISDCPSLTPIMNKAEFIIFKANLGKFVDSYGLLERRLNSLHDSFTKILTKTFLKNNFSVVYHLDFDMNNYNILATQNAIKFAETWTSKKLNVNVILPVPYLNQSNEENHYSSVNFITIPYIFEGESENLNANDKIKWYTGSALDALKNKFNILLLTYQQYVDFIAEFSNLTDIQNLKHKRGHLRYTQGNV